jgi:DNA-binding response OmpR family regulator
MRSTVAFGRLEQFHLEPELDVRRAVQRPYPARPPADVTPTEVSFGPFRLLRTRFRLLEGHKPVALGSRALQILIALLERNRELVSKPDLMARVSSNVFVEPANLTIDMSALRRRSAMGMASSSTSPSAATVFRRLVCRLTRIERNWRSIGQFGKALP